MKILTWNLGYWQHAKFHDEAWEYLCNELGPDLALLQEVKPPEWVSPDALLFEEITRGWGTAIYAPSLTISKREIPIHPGRVAAATVTVGPEKDVFVASVHAPIINSRVFPHLADIFSQLESMSSDQSAIVGGDLNSARLAETIWPRCGHGPFFERIDAGDRWVDCCRRFHPEEIQTFFRKNGVHPIQDDHLFVSLDLGDHLHACDVIDNDVTRRVSDHIPIVTILDGF